MDKVFKYVSICRNRKYWEEHVLDFNLLLVLFVFPLLFYYVLFTNNNIFCVSRLKWDLTLHYESHNLLLLSFSLCHSKWLLTTNLHIKVMLSLSLSLSFFLSLSLSISFTIFESLKYEPLFVFYELCFEKQCKATEDKRCYQKLMMQKWNVKDCNIKDIRNRISDEEDL